MRRFRDGRDYGFKTIKTLIREQPTADDRRRERYVPVTKTMMKGEKRILVYLLTVDGCKATQGEIHRVGMGGRLTGGCGMYEALNRLWEKGYVRFLEGDVVEMTDSGKTEGMTKAREGT